MTRPKDPRCCGHPSILDNNQSNTADAPSSTLALHYLVTLDSVDCPCKLPPAQVPVGLRSSCRSSSRRVLQAETYRPSSAAALPCLRSKLERELKIYPRRPPDSVSLSSLPDRQLDPYDLPADTFCLPQSLKVLVLLLTGHA